MKISIRILDIPNEIIRILENQNIKSIFDLLRSDLSHVFQTDKVEIVEAVLRVHKKREIKKELQGKRRDIPYHYLDEKYPLKEMDLSLRTLNALNNSAIYNISSLLELIEEIKIYDIENLGTKSVLQLIEKINEVVESEKLEEVIPIYSRNHPADLLPIEKLNFSQGAINSLHNLGIIQLKQLREEYLSGKLLDLFSYKTLKVILEEFGKYYTDFPNPEFSYFKTLLIEKYLGRISISDLQIYTKNEEIDFELQDFLFRLANGTDLIISSEEIRLPYFKEKLKYANLKKESEAILIKRFNGATLQKVADKFHKTRERIRQIVRDRMSRISMFYEESFVKEYNKFVWHPEVFKKIYGLDDFSFNIVKYLGYKFSYEEEFVFPEEYVKEMMAKSKIESLDLDEFKDSLPGVFDERIEIYGKTVPKMTKRVFLEYVIEHFVPEQGLHKTKIVEIAKKVVADNNLDYQFEKYIDIVSNTIQSLQSVRYYDYDLLTPGLIEELKQIVYEVDSVYSCNYFYKKYPNLMKRTDIRDGYELHFVLRRYFSNLEEFVGRVDFNRQPMLASHGKTYNDVVKENWSRLKGPTKLENFTNSLINKYGYHSGTLVNIINATLGDYISLKTVYNFKPQLSESTFEKIKEIMKDEFYELSELAIILGKEGIDPSGYQYFSNLWLNELGYKTHDVNYIIKEGYSSLKEIFFKKVLSEDIYQITKKDRKIRETTLILFIETLREEYLAFQYQKNKLINSQYLEKQGVLVADIKAYVAALSSIIPKNKYFTYESLLKDKYYLKSPNLEKLENKKLDKDLMINFIRNIPGVKKTTKGNLFRVSKKQSTVGDFLDQIMKETGLNEEEAKVYGLEHYNFKIR